MRLVDLVSQVPPASLELQANPVLRASPARPPNRLAQPALS